MIDTGTLLVGDVCWGRVGGSDPGARHRTGAVQRSRGLQDQAGVCAEPVRRVPVPCPEEDGFSVKLQSEWCLGLVPRLSTSARVVIRMKTKAVTSTLTICVGVNHDLQV